MIRTELLLGPAELLGKRIDGGIDDRAVVRLDHHLDVPDGRAHLATMP